MDGQVVTCPKCDSSSVDYISRRGGYCCADCNHFFELQTETGPLRIFLSYGHDDKSFIADRLKKELENLGHEVWYDSEKLKYSQDWESYIEKGIDWIAEVGARGRFLLLMTPHSIRRPDGFCLNELTRAMERQISIFPVMVQWCEPPLSICRLQWLDLRFSYRESQFTEKFDSSLKELVNAIVSNTNDFDGSLQRIRTVLDPVAFEASTLPHLRRFVGRKWVIDSIESWLENENGDKVFWIVGGPGSGKSALASWLQFNRSYIKSFFLCKAASTGSGGHGIYEPGDPRWCVRTIAYHLCSMLPDYRDRLAKLDLERITKENSAESMFEKLITEELYGIRFEDEGKVLVLIDGLDEITKDGRNELVEFLVKHVPNTPDWLRFIITSRYEEPLISALQRYKPFNMDGQQQLNLLDHRYFIEKEFKKFEGEKILDEEMQQEIIRKSEGNFLYLEQLRDSLEKRHLSLDNVKEFPQGLGEFYRMYFTRKFIDIKYYREYFYLKLAIMGAVSVPITIEEAESLFGWDKGYELKEFKNSFGALFRYDDDQIRFYHQSLIEWIASDDKAGDYAVRIEKGYEYIAARGYAVFKEGKKQLTPGESKCIRELPECLVKLRDYTKLCEFLTDLDIFVEYFSLNIFSYISYWNTLCREDKSENRTLVDCVKILAQKVSTEKYISSDSRETWKAYLAIARLFFQFNEYEEGAKMYLEALSVLPEGHEDEKGHIYNDVGECYLRLGRYNDVEPNYKKALEIRKAIYDKHPDLADSINNYGHTYFYSGLYEEALVQYKQAYDMWISIPDGPHFGEADCLNNMAVCLKSLGRNEEAEAAYEKGANVLDTIRSLNPFAVICRDNYAEYLEEEGRYEEAGVQYRKAYDLLLKLYGPDFERCLEHANKLAFFYYNNGKSDKAIALFTEAEEVCSRIFGKDDLRTINASLLVGEALLYSGKSDEALVVISQVIKRLEASKINDVGVTGRALHGMANVHVMSGSYEVALPYAQQAVEIREKTNLVSIEDIIKSYLLVLDCYLDLNELEKLKTLITTCRDKYIINMLMDRKEYYEFMMHAARALRMADCWDDARALYEEVISRGNMLVEFLDRRDQLKDGRIYEISVAINEFVFYEFQPKQMWSEAAERLQQAVKLMEKQENDIELANMQLNLYRAKHYAGQPVDREAVNWAHDILQQAGDPRAEKAIEMLGRH